MTRLLTAGCLLAIGLVGAGHPSTDADTDDGKKPADAPRYALLVGCTTYTSDSGITPLRGPVNDVDRWGKMLTSQTSFQFPTGNITRLVGWPDEETKRPTRANIVTGFENLIAKAGPGVQIVIVLSGHGTQCPIPVTQDPLDPKNPEPDGLDEVFLPADAQRAVGFPVNGIRDDEIGRWLDQMRNKGALVWIVFDCCHSGTMTRGGPDPLVTPRMIDPMYFATPEQLDAAARRAKAAVDAAGMRKPADETVAASAGANQGGGVVAFYAAQPHETAPEMPLPEGQPNTAENIFGMLSYSVIGSLEQRQAPLTYRELVQLIGGRYKAALGAGQPTPFAEGDLDREVLGLKRWPQRSAVVIEPVDGKLRLTAGSLRGLTRGTVLAVRRPAAGAGDPNEVLGHVRVDSASAATAEVSVFEFGGKPAIAIEKVPPLGRCEVVSRDLGDLRVKVYADPTPNLTAALTRIDPATRELINTEVPEPRAEWVLRVATAEQAKTEYRVPGLTGDHVLLLRGEGRKRPTDPTHQEAEKLAAERAVAAGRTPHGKVYGTYPLQDVAALVGSLDRDLAKIYRWQSLWRVAAEENGTGAGRVPELKFEVRVRKHDADRVGEPLRSPTIASGERLLICLDNQTEVSGSLDELWVTAFYMDANMKIQILYTGLVSWRPTENKQVRIPIRVTAGPGGDGSEGMIVLAIPRAVHGNTPPDFSVLEQSSLRVASRGWKPLPPPKNSFDRVLNVAAGGGGKRGDMAVDVKSTPAMYSQSWVLLPDPPKKP